MKEKKQNILDILSEGLREETTMTNSWGFKESGTKVTNSFGEYFFKDETEISRREKSVRRKETNRLSYGDERGRSAVFRDNQTAKELSAFCKKDCSVYYALYLESLKAERKIQEYVFKNGIIWMKKHGVNLSEMSFFTASVLPPAWTRGFENAEIFSFDGIYQAEDLTPAIGFEIGQKVLARYGREKSVGTIVGYTFLREGKYSGKYVIHYDVRFSSKWDHAYFKLKELSLNLAAAV